LKSKLLFAINRHGFLSHAFFKWVISSAVERLVYTERAGGSIPSSPTIFLIIAILFLTACGRKGKLEPDEKDFYPRTYPIFVEETLK
jgi:hypothetical protein